MICKPRGLKLQKFVSKLQNLNSIIPQLHGSDDHKKIPQEELHEILFCDVPHGWANQATMIGFDFESDSFHTALELFKRM